MTTSNADIKIEDVSRQLTTIFNIDSAIGREWTTALSNPNTAGANTVFALRALMAGRTPDFEYDLNNAQLFFSFWRKRNPSDKTPDWTPGQDVHLIDSTKNVEWEVSPNGDVIVRVHRDGEEKVAIYVAATEDPGIEVAYSPVTIAEDWYNAYKALIPVKDNFTAFAKMAKHFTGVRD